MRTNTTAAVLRDWGEKRLIDDIVRPVFNPDGDPDGVGDDCAVVSVPPGHQLVTSTDRVPADLTAFRLGLLDHRGLGDYLGRLNLSDVAACGGRPAGLLFNAGMPPSFPVGSFEALCLGLRDAAARAECRVIGGDVSLCEELSLSATVFGTVPGGAAVPRSGATPGDAIFATRPIGLTPAAFAVLVPEQPPVSLTACQRRRLERQFTSLDPLLDLGRTLREAGATSLMDNTDGLGQSLHELAAASRTAFVIDGDELEIDATVASIAEAVGEESIDFALGAGADFSLVGTIAPDRMSSLPAAVVRIGSVEAGGGLWLDYAAARRALTPRGWNYFLSEPAGALA